MERLAGWLPAGLAMNEVPGGRRRQDGWTARREDDEKESVIRLGRLDKRGMVAQPVLRVVARDGGQPQHIAVEVRVGVTLRKKTMVRVSDVVKKHGVVPDGGEDGRGKKRKNATDGQHARNTIKQQRTRHAWTRSWERLLSSRFGVFG